MKALRSLAALLVGTVVPGLAAASCTSGATPNCSPDAGGSDACGQAFDGGTSGDATADSPTEGATDTGAAMDTSMAMEAATDTGSSGDSMSAGEGGEAGGD